MMESRLLNELSAPERALRLSRLWRELAWGWVAAACGGVFSILLQSFTGWASPLVWTALVTGALVAALVAWRRYRRCPVDFHALAALVERDYPELRHVLAAAVEQEPHPETGRFGFLQLRVIDEVLAHRRRHLWDLGVEQRLLSARTAHFLALSVFVVVILVLGQATHSGRPVFGPEVVGGVTVSPGDATVERGSGLVISARFGGRAPGEATLTVLSASGKNLRIPLTRPLADPVFGASLSEVTEDGIYHIEYGAQRTRDFKITVFDYPALVRADAQLDYPAYTGLAEKTIPDTRRISAAEGTRLNYTLQLNKPVARARLVGKDQTLTLTVQSNAAALLADFPLTNSARYSLQLVDADGRTNKTPAEFVMQALPDKPPELKLTFPRGDQRVSSLEEMQVAAEATDDYGLLKYGLGYNVVGQKPQMLELGQAAPGNEKRPMQYLLALEKLGVEPDQLISYFAWADDLGPDGKERRTYSDMYFAEVRPFDEIFRRDQSGADANNERANQGGQTGNESGDLAELQKEIVIATWKLQGQGAARTNYVADATTVKESQEQAHQQASSLIERLAEPRAKESMEAAMREMQQAADHLGRAIDTRSTEPLPAAVSAEQSAYQALLKLQPRDYRVQRNRNQGQRGGQQANRRNQRQLDQLEMTDESNRYETERQASAAPTQQQREQLQVANRLRALAQRQQDMNERMRELQTALQEARTDQEREEIRRQLKRLRDEERQMLADVDELRQRMDQSPDATSLAQARQRLEQTRSDVQRAAQQLEQEAASQALASGTRAQQDLQQLHDDFRRQTSSQFTEQMRQLRNEARDLSREQQEIARGLDALDQQGQLKTLDDAAERQQLAQRLTQQQSGLTNLVAGMRAVTEQAENTEPLLARQLYDTLRNTDQSRTENLLQMGAQLVDRGFVPQAVEAERGARQNIDQLRQGVERAAENVLGDETEALRYAVRELDDLTRQVQREVKTAAPTESTSATNVATVAAAENRSSPPHPSDRPLPAEQTPTAQHSAETAAAEANQAQDGNRPGAATEARGGNRPGNANGAREGGSRSGNANDRGGGGLDRLRQLAEQFGADGGGDPGGPITGGDFVNWSDRLRDVQDALDNPDLRNQVATVRERVAGMRAEYRRYDRRPQLERLQTQVLMPMTQVRVWLQDELARRENADGLVPLDRDPVPGRYSDLVRRYYEKLGSDQ